MPDREARGCDFFTSRHSDSTSQSVCPRTAVRNFAAMRLTTLALLLLATTLSAQTEHGVFMQDIDTNADACTDFFDYANGAWRAANPIPASMQRWSRRWAAGEQNKEQLRDVLDDDRSAPTGRRASHRSADQRLLRRPAWTRRASTRSASKPIQPLLDEIDAIKTPADLQKTIAELHDLQIYAPFGIDVDVRQPQSRRQVIARVFAAGLGLPDRDYYLKPEKRFVEARAKYREHVTKMFELAGSEPRRGEESRATRSSRWRRASPTAQLDNVALRDPAATDHKYAVATLQKMHAAFDWDALSRARQASPHADLNVDQPKFMGAVEQELRATPLDARGRRTCAWHVINAARRQSAPTPFVDEHFAFYGKYLGGAKEMKPRWKRCVEADDALLGEALGQRYVEQLLPARGQGAHAGDGEEPPARRWATPSAASTG